MLIALLVAVAGVVFLHALSAARAPAAVPLVAAPGPNSRFLARFTVTDAPEQFEQVIMVIDFPPRTWTLLHRPGGNVYNTVIDGEISTRRRDVPNSEMTYPSGDAFVETTGEWIEIGNTADANAHVIATALLPIGAPFAVNEQGFSTGVYLDFGAGHRGLDTVARPLGPTIVDRSSISVDRPSRTLELVQWLVQFDPGVWTPRHVHGGQELALVASGELTLERRGEAEVFKAGAAWVNQPGVIHAEGNAGQVIAQVVATFLLPEGAPLTTA